MQVVLLPYSKKLQSSNPCLGIFGMEFFCSFPTSEFQSRIMLVIVIGLSKLPLAVSVCEYGCLLRFSLCIPPSDRLRETIAPCHPAEMSRNRQELIRNNPGPQLCLKQEDTRILVPLSTLKGVSKNRHGLRKMYLLYMTTFKLWRI